MSLAGLQRRAHRSRRSVSHAGRNDERARRRERRRRAHRFVDGGHQCCAVITTFVVALLCGFARGWVDVGPGFGVTILVTFAIALALPAPTVSGALLRALYILVGGAWAMLLAIVLWPLRPYRPVRLRVADCYRAIARYMETAATRSAAGSYDPTTLTSHVVAVRTALESARTALAISRRGRSVESGRGERLLVLHEIADQVFVHVIALLELGALRRHRRLARPRATRAQRDARRSLGDDSLARRRVQSEIDLPRVTLGWDGTGLRAVQRLDGRRSSIASRTTRRGGRSRRHA